MANYTVCVFVAEIIPPHYVGEWKKCVNCHESHVTVIYGHFFDNL